MGFAWADTSAYAFIISLALVLIYHIWTLFPYLHLFHVLWKLCVYVWFMYCENYVFMLLWILRHMVLWISELYGWNHYWKNGIMDFGTMEFDMAEIIINEWYDLYISTIMLWCLISLQITSYCNCFMNYIVGELNTYILCICIPRQITYMHICRGSCSLCLETSCQLMYDKLQMIYLCLKSSWFLVVCIWIQIQISKYTHI